MKHGILLLGIIKEVPLFLLAFSTFNLVRYDILFELLLSHGLPSVVVRLLHSWYVEQKLSNGEVCFLISLLSLMGLDRVASYHSSPSTWIHYSMTCRVGG